MYIMEVPRARPRRLLPRIVADVAFAKYTEKRSVQHMRVRSAAALQLRDALQPSWWRELAVPVSAVYGAVTAN